MYCTGIYAFLDIYYKFFEENVFLAAYGNLQNSPSRAQALCQVFILLLTSCRALHLYGRCVFSPCDRDHSEKVITEQPERLATLARDLWQYPSGLQWAYNIFAIIRTVKVNCMLQNSVFDTLNVCAPSSPVSLFYVNRPPQQDGPTIFIGEKSHRLGGFSPLYVIFILCVEST